MFRRRAAWTGVIALTFATSGCGGNSCDDTVITPGGPRAKQCVHQVPNGGTIVTDDAGTTSIIVNGKVVESFPPCPCASSPHIGPPHIAEIEADDDAGTEDALGDGPQAESTNADTATGADTSME